MTRQPKTIAAHVTRVAGEGGGLVSMTEASRIIGVPSSNFARSFKSRLTLIPVEGSGAVYLRAEVELLAAERASKST